MPERKIDRRAEDYALTPLGRGLADAIIPLCTWGTKNAAQMASIFAERDSLPSNRFVVAHPKRREAATARHHELNVMRNGRSVGLVDKTSASAEEPPLAEEALQCQVPSAPDIRMSKSKDCSQSEA